MCLCFIEIKIEKKKAENVYFVCMQTANVQNTPCRVARVFSFTHDFDRYIYENQENEQKTRRKEKRRSKTSAVRYVFKKKNEIQLFKLKT